MKRDTVSLRSKCPSTAQHSPHLAVVCNPQDLVHRELLLLGLCLPLLLLGSSSCICPVRGWQPDQPQRLAGLLPTWCSCNRRLAATTPDLHAHIIVVRLMLLFIPVKVQPTCQHTHTHTYTHPVNLTQGSPRTRQRLAPPCLCTHCQPSASKNHPSCRTVRTAANRSTAHTQQLTLTEPSVDPLASSVPALLNSTCHTPFV